MTKRFADLPKKGDRRAALKQELGAAAVVHEPLWEPRSTPQRQALECTPDILLFGGSAGGLKTASLLVAASIEIENPN